MLSDILIVGLVMAIVEIIKTATRLETKDYGDIVIPLLVFFIAGVVNVLNAQLFGDVTLIEALKEGLILGASAGGIFSMGKSVIEGTKEVI